MPSRRTSGTSNRASLRCRPRRITTCLVTYTGIQPQVQIDPQRTVSEPHTHGRVPSIDGLRGICLRVRLAFREEERSLWRPL